MDLYVHNYVSEKDVLREWLSLLTRFLDVHFPHICVSVVSMSQSTTTCTYPQIWLQAFIWSQCLSDVLMNQALKGGVYWFDNM